MKPSLAATHADDWFAARGWAPFPFQREVWAAMVAGRSGLLHATTGSGKTYAVWFGALLRAAAKDADAIFVDVGDLGRDPANAARSERPYKHDGVAAHPGDRGMKSIADAIVAALDAAEVPRDR